jgi:hypothetical protein
MKTYHWFVLGFGFMLIANFFISMDTINPMDCDPSIQLLMKQIDEGKDVSEINIPENDPLDVADVWCIMNAEMYDPFIWMFYGLTYLFLAMVVIDTFINWKKKKK